ncbi:MAG: 50S ribosomal protein L25 [Patescibacteria group bacterium]|jgi:large subunit ribosomal protein L25
METVKLAVKGRSVKGKQVKTLRTAGVIPAVVYGHGVDSRPVEVDYKIFEKVLDQAGESTLVDLVIDGGETVKVLIQDVQRDPLKDTITHVDLRQVRMTEKLDVDIEINFIGEAPAVKESGAILVRSMSVIAARCLPGDLVHAIDVDLTGMKKIGDIIKVKDLAALKGIEFMANPNEVIAVVNEPISEAELKAMEAKPVEDVSAVKVEADEKKAAAAAEEPAEDKKEKKK